MHFDVDTVGTDRERGFCQRNQQVAAPGGVGLLRFYGAVQLIGRLDFIRSAPRAIRVIEEEFT